MCGCNGGGSNQPSSPTFEVHLPNGEIRRVESEEEARTAIRIAGGGTYSKR